MPPWWRWGRIAGRGTRRDQSRLSANADIGRTSPRRHRERKCRRRIGVGSRGTRRSARGARRRSRFTLDVFIRRTWWLRWCALCRGGRRLLVFELGRRRFMRPQFGTQVGRRRFEFRRIRSVGGTRPGAPPHRVVTPGLGVGVARAVGRAGRRCRPVDQSRRLGRNPVATGRTHNEATSECESSHELPFIVKEPGAGSQEERFKRQIDSSRLLTPDSRPLPYYSCPKPNRSIRFAMAVPSDTKPKMRSNGAVYLRTNASSVIIGSCAMNSRSPGIS
jgi:hypothetical protein